MIERPKDLVTVDVEIEFNTVCYVRLEIDLGHVNKGGRSQYSVAEVGEIVKSFLDSQILQPSGNQFFGDYYCDYFVVKKEMNKNKYKLVFCVCSDRPDTIGVITLFKETK